MRSSLLLASLFVVVTVATARADIHPQVSYSMAIGKSHEQLFGHLWAGGGIHGNEGGFVLAGLEAEFRDRPDEIEARSTEPMPIRDPGGPELWLAVRPGIGAYKMPKSMAPLAALYAITGRRIAGADDAPHYRLGLGLSIPAMLPLARIGIPTMIEGGVDLGGLVGTRWYVRTGWNL
jgi:hypothetical protein